MNISHLNAMAKTLGFENISDYLRDRYVDKRWTQDEICEEISLSKLPVRKLLGELCIEKPKLDIPMTYEDAKRMGPDGLAVKYKVSRATAWRWKRIVMARHADLEADGEDYAPDAGAK